MTASIQDFVIPFIGKALYNEVDLGAIAGGIKLRARMASVEFGKTQSDHGRSKIVAHLKDVEVEVETENMTPAMVWDAIGTDAVARAQRDGLDTDGGGGVATGWAFDVDGSPESTNPQINTTDQRTGAGCQWLDMESKDAEYAYIYKDFQLADLAGTPGVGDTIRYTVWARTASIASDRRVFFMVVEYRPGVGFGQYNSDEWLLGTNWRKYVFTHTIDHATVTYLRVMICMRNDTPGTVEGEFFLDDFEIVKDLGSETARTLELQLGMDDLRGIDYPTRYDVEISNMRMVREQVETAVERAKQMHMPLLFRSTSGFQLRATERIVIPATILLRGEVDADLTQDELGRAFTPDAGAEPVTVDQLQGRPYGLGAYKMYPSSGKAYLLQTVPSADVAPGVEPMTIGGWFTPTFDQVSVLAGLRYSAAYGWQVSLTDDGYLSFVGSQGTGVSSIEVANYDVSILDHLTYGVPFFWCIVRTGTDLLLFIDGVLHAWDTITTPVGHNSLDPMTDGVHEDFQFMVGDAFNGGYCAGWASDVFYTVGTALWTESFTVPYTQLAPAV